MLNVGKCHIMRTSSYTHQIFFLVLCVGFVLSFYPGLMSDDSHGIYASAQAHQYNDHHPPLMAYLWHYLLFIKDGPAMMFLFNMCLLWSTIYILAFRVFKKGLLHILCFLIPFMPQIAVYAGFLWKDIIFTFGYGLLSSILAYHHIHHKRLTFPTSSAFFILLFYCTSVKYQAQFICPIIVYWYVWVQSPFGPSKRFIAAMVVSLLLTQSIYITNHFLVTEHGNGSSHSWQYRNIFDLAGMSVNSHKLLLPPFLIKDQATLADIESHYELAWEPLIVYPHSPLNATSNNDQRAILKKTWIQAISSHPLAYIKHRMHVWGRGILLSSPGKGWFDEKTGPNHPLKQLSPLFSLFAYICLIPIQIANAVIAYRSLKIEQCRAYAQCSLILSIMSATLILMLFVLTLAGVPRYIYFSFFMFFLSCPFAGHCWIYWLRNRKQILMA